MPGGQRGGKDFTVVGIHPHDRLKLRRITPLKLASETQIQEYRNEIPANLSPALIVHHGEAKTKQISAPPPLVTKYRSSLSGNSIHQGPSPYPNSDEEIRLAVNLTGGIAATRGSSGSPVLDPESYCVYGIVFGGDLQIIKGRPLYTFGKFPSHV